MVTIASRQIFKIDDEDDRDPFEVLEELKLAKQHEEKAKKDQKAPTKSKAKSSEKQKSVVKPAQQNLATAQSETQGSPQQSNNRGGSVVNRNVRSNRGGRGGSVAFSSNVTELGPREISDTRGRNNAPLRGGSAGGRGRGVTGNRNPAHPFDRHSGSRTTGVKPVEKKNGSGAYNWGSTEDALEGELDGEQLATDPSKAEVDQSNEGKASDENSGENDPDAAAPESEDVSPKVMTLDEYRASDNAERARLDNLMNKTTAGGNKAKKADLNKVLRDFQKKNNDEEVTVYQKIESEESEEEVENEESMAHKRKNYVDFKLNYGGHGRGGRGRGGRGGQGFGRGGRGRPSSGRGGQRPQAESIDLNSKDDFPALS